MEGAASEPLLAAAAAAVGPLGGQLEPRADAEEPRDALGRLVLSFLHTVLPGRLDDLQTPRVAGLVRQLRQRVTLAICCTLLTAPIAVWLLVRGVATYVATDNAQCGGPLRVWLLGFLMLELAWPICMPSLTLLLLGWCLGAMMLLHKPQHCDVLREFLIEASALQLVQASLLLGSAAAALTARPLIRRLSDLLSQSGTDPEIVSHIDVVQPGNVPADEECVICLSRDLEDNVPWRRLICGHQFHEPCLLEWLGKARRCPVCRLDLHQQFRRGTQIHVGAYEAQEAAP
mmetsp:Transcript_108851/g.306753  ORF Transcript_108851/g.306753 Transcript_108851/m.306753 type:complete len:288 (-) Transcript_108851:117-980(-)